MTSFALEHSPDDALVPPKKIVCYTDLELAALPAPREAIEGMLYCDSVAMIVAKWGSYKTFFALELAACMALGADYNGRRAAHGSVIYVSAEGRRGLPSRVGALRAKYGGISDTFPLVLVPQKVDITKPLEVALLMAEADLKLQELGFYHLEIAAVFIDTVARNMSGNENDVEAMGRFLDGCHEIRERTGALVAVVHHTGWEGTRARGSSSLPGNVDTEIVLTREENSNRVTVHNSKQRDAAEFADFTLEPSPIAGSLVLDPVAPTSSRLSPNEVRALHEVPTDPGISSTGWERATGLSDGSFNRARRRLLDLAYVKRIGGKYARTDAGTMALGARCQAGATEVPE